MRRPSQHRLQDPPAVRERTKRIRASCVAEEVSVARRVGKVVDAVPLVHPRGLEEAAVVVICEDRLAGFRGEDGDFLDGGCELVHVVCELGDAGALGDGGVAADFLGALPGWVEDVVALLVALQLTSPQSTKVEIRLTVIIHKGRRVDAIAPLDRLGIRRERALGLIAHRDADAEDALLVAGREVEIILSILLRGVGRPHLLGDPGDVLGAEDDAVVGDGAGGAEGGGAEDVVVGHVVLVAIVVELDVGFAVVGGVDVDLVVEDVGGGVGRVDVCDERRHLFPL